jgi:hypothetical protein
MNASFVPSDDSDSDGSSVGAVVISKRISGAFGGCRPRRNSTDAAVAIIAMAAATPMTIRQVPVDLLVGDAVGVDPPPRVPG